MRCRTLGIRLEQPFAAIDEAAASEFMESVRVRKVTASMCEGPAAAWSLLVFFEDGDGREPVKAARAKKAVKGNVAAKAPAEPAAIEGKAPEAGQVSLEAAREQVLTPAEELLVKAIKQWRSGKASEERVPPYCVAQNRSIEDIARRLPRTVEELAGIKGFGPARIEKYGDELITLVAFNNGGATGS